MSDLLVFCCDYSNPPIDMSLLRRSCERVGIDIQTYGNGQAWPSYGAAKITDALAFLRTRSESHVLYTDSQDSFLVHGESVIMSGYQRCGSPQILLQVEKNCYPAGEWCDKYPKTNSPWKYVCAGGWMGKREALIQALEELASGAQFQRTSNDDQSCWHDWYVSNPTSQLRAALDTNCEVFQSMANSAEVGWDGLNRVTGTRPSVLHFNGRVGKEREFYRSITGDAL